MITMPAELKVKWLEALRSGKYKQGKLRLCRDNTFCCLGVLEMVAEGEVETYENDSDHSRATPSHEFLNRNKIDTADTCFFVEGYGSLTNLNDCGSSFNQIADVIEE